MPDDAAATASEESKSASEEVSSSSAARFLQQTLRRVSDSEHLSMGNRVQLLERSLEDLRRLGDLEPAVSGEKKRDCCTVSWEYNYFRQLLSFDKQTLRTGRFRHFIT